MRYSPKRARGPYSPLGATITGSPIDASLSLLADVERPVISLAVGSPAPDMIPVAMLAELAAEALAGPRSSAALDYVPTEGEPRLRGALIERLSQSGLDVDPANLLITAGGMQGLDLVARLFVGPGDVVAVEAPSYANGLATLRNHGAFLTAIATDDDGMVVDELATRIAGGGAVPRVVYTIPTFQNPSGTTMSLSRRQALLALAERHRIVILEDDPYGELRYAGDPLPSLLSLDGGAGNVIAVRTFSKIVTPGLRVGWVVAPSEVIGRMVMARQSMDTCANSLGQAIVGRMLRADLLDRHVKDLLRTYPVRRDAMLASLAREFSPADGVTWTRPDGGLFIWLSLPSAMSGDELAAACIRHGVVVVPGSAFCLGGDQPAVRLCFSSVREADIAPAITALGAAFRELSGDANRIDIPSSQGATT